MPSAVIMSERPSGRLPLRNRPSRSIALETSSGSFSVEAIRAGAVAVAQQIRKGCDDMEPRRNSSRPCLLIPSSNPAQFLVGLLGCNLAQTIAVPWRDSMIGAAAAGEPVRPDAALRFDGASIDGCSLERLDFLPFEGRRRGELVMLTSGSTGQPKGVALDFRKVVLNAVAAGSALGVSRCRAWCIDIDLALMSAVCHLLMAWQFDVPLVVMGGIKPTHLSDLLDGPFGFGGSPMQLVRLHELLPPGRTPKLLASSGDFFPPQMIDAVRARYPSTEIHKFYGLTELAGRFCHMPHDALMQNKAAAGEPLPGYDVRLSREEPEGVGQIEARSPLLFEGYYQPGGLFEPFEGEWFATGDLGTIDSHGVVTLVGRADDVFKVGGEKVDRHSIEAALSDLLAAGEYCVVPVEHEMLGQCPALFVATRDAAATPRWSEIVAHLRSRVPNRFVPSLMYKVESELPRLASGKIDRMCLARNHARFDRLI